MPDQLREIADQLQGIPKALEQGHLRSIDAATLAGRLMLDAMQCGLFKGSQWLGLRHVIEMAAGGELEHQFEHAPGSSNDKGEVSPPAGWHAFVNGCIWLLRDSGEEIGDVDAALVTRGCALIGKHIDAELKRLEGPVSLEEPPPEEDQARWLRFVEAERITAISRGTLKRSADKGDLIDNGKAGNERRVDAASLCRFVLKRAQPPETTESDEQVNRLFNKSGT